MAKKAAKKNTVSRRAQRRDLVEQRVKLRKRIARRVRLQAHRAWSPIKTVGSKSYNLPTPKGRTGKVLAKRIRGPKYFRESWAELKKVTWPNRQETWRLTWAVFIFSAFFALFTSLADFGLTKAVERIILK